jgi:hypothetical protein
MTSGPPQLTIWKISSQLLSYLRISQGCIAKAWLAILSLDTSKGTWLLRMPWACLISGGRHSAHKPLTTLADTTSMVLRKFKYMGSHFNMREKLVT